MIGDRIAAKCSEAVKALYGKEISPAEIGIQKTKKEFEGDFTIVVFPLARLSGRSPEMTAGEIGQFLSQELEEVASFNVIKGFLNLSLHDHFWTTFLKEHHLEEKFGLHPPRHEAPVVLEYSSPNTNKPLHLGHIRNNLLGFSLARILKANGYKVVRVNLVNDRGIHICKSMLAYVKWGNGETPASSGIKGDHLVGKYYVIFDKYFKEEIRDLLEKGLTEDEAMGQAPLMQETQEYLRRWEAHDPEILGLWRMMNGWAYEGFDTTYSRLGVDFDKVYYESETYLLGKKLVEEGLEKEIFTEREDGSVWIDLNDHGMDEKLLRRSDGTSVYMTQDLGTAQLRYDDFHPSRMIYVVGNEQNYHFDVLRIVLEKMQKEYAGKVHHLSYGMVELPQGRMKSREGTIVDADDLMDEMRATAEQTTRELGKVSDFSEEEAARLFTLLGLGALKYFILKVDPKKNMLFDPKESIDFNGNTGPFIQYTHARIRSLLRKASGMGISTSHPGFKYGQVSLVPREKEILRILYQFPAVVEEAGNELSPALVANYVYELAKEYNTFYQEVPVLREEAREIVMLRLLLSEMTGRVIRSAMCLLGIDVPDRM
jgi:arginyl-tRNA synthetase